MIVKQALAPFRFRWVIVASALGAGTADGDVAAPRAWPAAARSAGNEAKLVARGRYLATIGACAACHTPPAVTVTAPGPLDPAAIERERRFRTDPDWYRYLDPSGRNHLAGGVPFHFRFSATSTGTVFSTNITPDPMTGLAPCPPRGVRTPTCWTEDDLIEMIRTGRARPHAARIFLFPPHSFFKNLADDDARALAVYLRSVPPVRNEFLRAARAARKLPPEFAAASFAAAKPPATAPAGRSVERGRYLVNAIVGCRECHSYQKFTASGPVLQEFVGGDPTDPFVGVFRLGPDLPLRADERGFAVFPYPGYAVLYSGNLTRFGAGGDLAHVPDEVVVRAIREGVSVVPDDYGRPRPLAHVMLWQFYASMTDDDAFSIVAYLRTLRYVAHRVDPKLELFGNDWKAAFRATFGRFNTLSGYPADAITQSDLLIMGKEAQ